MPKKKTKEEFISESIKIFGNKYDYSKVRYINNRSKVTIICSEHGEFEKSPEKHLIGQGCRECKGYVELNQNSFVRRSLSIHGEKYDYSKSVIKSKKDKVTIVCYIHGDFQQLPGNHIKGQGCPKCAKILRSETQRYSKEEFINSVQKKHKNKYDYSLVDYVNSQTKVTIICPYHGAFKMRPNSHFSGQGCRICGYILSQKKTRLDFTTFLNRAGLIHQNKYEYVEDSYVNYTTKMKMFCADHGFFFQIPHSHVSMKSGCPKCGIKKAASSNQKSWETIKIMFEEVHGDRFKYDKSSFVDVSTKMKIKCNIHGWFLQKPYSHYGGSSCTKCSIIEVHEKLKINFEDFMKKSIETHKSRYKYFKEDYIDIFTPTKILCEKHGVFLQSPRNHYRGSGCTKCKSSRGENLVRQILQSNKIEFNEQHTFDNLYSINKLKCDFYLPLDNTVIEYNGLQHYEPISIFGGLEGLKDTQKRDFIKYEFLKKEKIKLIIIRYDCEDVESYLLKKLGIKQKNPIVISNLP